MNVEGRVQVKMRASVGTLRAHSVQWVEPERAALLVEKAWASYAVEPEQAVSAVAAEPSPDAGTARHVASSAAPEQAKEVQADGAKSDEGKGAARPRRRAGNGDGGSDPAGRLDQSADGKQG